MFDFNCFPCSWCDMYFLLRLCGTAYPRYDPSISTAQWKTGLQLLSWNWKDGVNFHNNLMDLSSSSDKQVCAYFLVDLPINSLVICNNLEVPVFYTNWKNSLSSHSDPWHSLCCLLASPWENAGVHWMLWSLMHLCSDGARKQINGPSVENTLVSDSW